MHMKSIISGILAICALGIIVFALSTVGGVQAQEPSHLANAPASQQSLGIPAIVPTLNSATTTPPTFTVEDVKRYIASHGFHGGPTVTGNKPQIRVIAFISSKQASTRLHDASIGLPDTAVVCYVELGGPFQVRASLPSGAPPFPPSNIGVDIFDAQTGNLVMEWTQGYNN